jgi:hypothetical protein
MVASRISVGWHPMQRQPGIKPKHRNDHEPRHLLSPNLPLPVFWWMKGHRDKGHDGGHAKGQRNLSPSLALLMVGGPYLAPGTSQLMLRLDHVRLHRF